MSRGYTPEHLKLLHLVFGGRAGAVIPQVEIGRGGGRGDYCDLLRDGRIIVWHSDEGWTNDFVVVHEFAHAYCGFHWPGHMETVEGDRAEAAAHLAEWSLAANSDGFAARLVSERLPGWNTASWPHVQAAMRKQAADPTGTLHERMEEVLHG